MNKIDYIKSCKANLGLKIDNNNYNIINTELIRYFILNDENYSKQSYESYLINLLDNINLQYTYQVDTSLSCHPENENIYVGQTVLHNVSRVFQYNDPNNIPAEFNEYIKPHDKPTDFYTCKITEANQYNPNKIGTYPEYFIDNIFNEKSKEQQYLDNHSGQSFYFSNDKFVIVPEFTGNMPFIQNHIDNWKRIQQINKKENIDIYYDFFSNIQFVLFIKDSNITIDNLDKYQYKDIFSFLKNNKGDNIKLLKEIKQTIINFYKVNFELGDYLDINAIQIFINSDTKYNFCAFTFTMVNVYESIQYKSFIDVYRTLRLDDFIDMLEKSDEINYYTRLTPEQAKKYSCDGYRNPQYGGYQNINNLKTTPSGKTLELLFNIKKEDIKIFKILNSFYSNTVHTYCAEFFLIQLNDKIYELSIKSITYQILHDLINSDMRPLLKKTIQDFSDNFIKHLKESIKQNINSIQYDYVNNSKQIILFNQLLAMVEVYVKQVSNKIQNQIKLYTEETSVDYINKVVPEIKKATIDPSIIFHLVWKAECRKILKQYPTIKNALITGINLPKHLEEFHKITKKMINNAYLGIFLLDEFIFTENFTFNFRMVDNNLKCILYILNLLNTNFSEIDTKTFSVYIENIICNNNNNYDRKPFPILPSIITKDIYPNILFQLIEYIKQTSRLYILWYTPANLKITNYHQLEILLDKINKDPILNQDITDYQKTNDIMNQYGKEILTKITKEEVNSFCNFYELYENEDFVYNIRHVQNYKKEIDKLVKMLYDKYKFKTNYIVGAHYPNLSEFNIFHMHVYNPLYGKKDERLNENYFDMSIDRFFLWDKNIYPVNYQNKTILIRSLVQTQSKDKIIEELKKQLELRNRKGLYSEEKLINNNKLLFLKTV